MSEKNEVLVVYLFTFAIALAGVIIILFVQGCCRYCDPVQLPPKLVEVEKPCPLPPGPGKLPVPVQTTTNCVEKMVCYDIENAAKLAKRDSKLKQWIREAKARCAAPDAGVDR